MKTPYHDLIQSLAQNLSLKKLDSTCQEKIKHWLLDDVISQEDKLEIIALIENNDVDQLQDRFYKDLEFGTGGIRGIMGAGSNRLNRYVVRRVSQGFANYILNKAPHLQKSGIAIAYDCRNQSSLFAHEVAGVFSANQIPVFMFSPSETTPELSFAIRKLKCAGGMCITASHNPPEYNGLKIYWQDGAQVASPQDKGVLDEILKVSGFSSSKFMPIDEAQEKGWLQFIGDDVLNCYFDAIKKLSFFFRFEKRH